MVRIADIQRAFATLVGWEQDTDPDKKIQQDLTESDSGIIYQHAHPLVTLDNIRSTLRVDNASYPQWNAATNYAAGTVVLRNNKEYISVRSNSAVDPATDTYNNSFSGSFDNNTGYWREYDPMSELLRSSVKSSISTMVSRIVETKSIERTSRQLLEHKCLFDGVGRLTNRIESRHCLVGYEIEPLKGIGVTTQLHKVGLQITGGQGNMTIYLIHSLSGVVSQFTISVGGNNGAYRWYNLPDTFLRYMDGSTNSGGCWYVCYHQDGLPSGASAVNVSKNFATEPCGTCNIGSVNVWKTITRFMRVSPFRVLVDEEWADDPSMFDVDAIEYTPQTCYGMNLELSIGCDLTDFIVSNRHQFASLLQKQVAYDLLKRIAYNPEANVNRNQANVQRQDYIFEVDGNNYTKSSGLRGELERAYKAVEIDTEGMDSACLPCGRRGVRYGLA